VQSYLSVVKHLIEKIEQTQRPVIQRLAGRIADSIAEGGVLHIFGSGHSHMIAEDTFHRAGGLACINAMLEESLMEINVGRATTLERLSGYGELLLSGYSLKPGEVIVVISNSGINAVPIEIALECKKRGLYVVALTNMDHTLKVESRHSGKKRLYEVVDEVLDNCGVVGDATIQLEGLPHKVGPTSTISGIIIIQDLINEIIIDLLQRGITPPVFISANCDGGDEQNRSLEERYRKRVRYL
jgi:uncharacterized phosphosugar-binding protein